MKRLRKAVILTVIILMFAVVFTACDPSGGDETPVKLSAPANLQISGTTLTWDEVSGASGYVVNIGNAEHSSTAASYDLSGLTEPKTYQIKVKAKGNGTAYTDSDYSIVKEHVVKEQGLEPVELSAPANLQISGTTLTWDEVSGASGYVVNIGNAEHSSTAASYDLFELTEPKTYQIKVKAKGNGTAYTDSGYSIIREYVITVAFTAGLQFTPIKNGTQYSVSAGTATATDVVIPSHYLGKAVTWIADDAFRYYGLLTSVVIPPSITNIGVNAFGNCTSLDSVTIPLGVKSIGDWAFAHCSKLTSIIVPSSVTVIGINAFLGCFNLESITIPFVGSNIEGSGDTTFFHIFGKGISTDLTTVIITGGEAIGDEAFRNYPSITNITIPRSVKSIGINAFDNCIALKDIYFTGTEDEWNAIEKTNAGISPDVIIHYNC